MRSPRPRPGSFRRQFLRTTTGCVFLLLAITAGLLTGFACPALAVEKPASTSSRGLRLATFDVDATPPVGSLMAFAPVKRLDELTLRCRGIVLLGAGEPIVLCAVDWIGIGNEGHDAFRE